MTENKEPKKSLKSKKDSLEQEKKAAQKAKPDTAQKDSKQKSQPQKKTNVWIPIISIILIMGILAAAALIGYFVIK